MLLLLLCVGPYNINLDPSTKVMQFEPQTALKRVYLRINSFKLASSDNRECFLSRLWWCGSRLLQKDGPGLDKELCSDIVAL